MNPDAMQSQQHTLLRISVVAATVILLGAGGQEHEAPPTASDIGKLVKTIVVGSSLQGKTPGLPSRVEASAQVDLAFNVSGPLIELPVEEGQFVAKGTLLARIDPRDFQYSLALKKASSIKAKSLYERYARLIKSKNSPVSMADYQRKKSEYEVARANAKQAQKDLADTYLRAPFDGVIAVKYVNNFENVEAKQAILRLEDISHIDIILDVPERDVVNVACIKRVDCAHDVGLVSFASTPEQTFPATVKEYATKANPDTQTYELTLTMPRPKGINILPGMTASVVHVQPAKEKQTAIVVPRTAVEQAEKGKGYAWVVDMDTMLVRKQEVKVVDKTGDTLQVLAGLSPGDRIVAAGTYLLKEGMKVRLFKPNM
jgi:multidrug efflux system membrane fusion protein